MQRRLCVHTRRYRGTHSSTTSNLLGTDIHTAASEWTGSLASSAHADAILGQFWEHDSMV